MKIQKINKQRLINNNNNQIKKEIKDLQVHNFQNLVEILLIRFGVTIFYVLAKKIQIIAEILKTNLKKKLILRDNIAKVLFHKQKLKKTH